MMKTHAMSSEQTSKQNCLARGKSAFGMKQLVVYMRVTVTRAGHSLCLCSSKTWSWLDFQVNWIRVTYIWYDNCALCTYVDVCSKCYVTQTLLHWAALFSWYMWYAVLLNLAYCLFFMHLREVRQLSSALTATTATVVYSTTFSVSGCCYWFKDSVMLMLFCTCNIDSKSLLHWMPIALHCTWWKYCN